MNRPRLLFILILIISVAALARIKLAQAAAPPSAAAELRDAKGKVVGSAAFTTLSSGAVKVQVAVTGSPGIPVNTACTSTPSAVAHPISARPAGTSTPLARSTA